MKVVHRACTEAGDCLNKIETPGFEAGLQLFHAEDRVITRSEDHKGRIWYVKSGAFLDTTLVNHYALNLLRSLAKKQLDRI